VLDVTYDVRSIGRWFIKNNNDAAKPSLNGHLKLQKLLYYAQAMKLAVDDEPLFNNRIEAWEKGPVVSDMYFEYRHNDFIEIAKSTPLQVDFDSRTLKILQIVNHVYGTQTGTQLVDLTHSEEPWAELEEKVKNRENPEITQDKLREYYKSLKDIYDLYEDYDFESECTEKINGNIFVYNRFETELDNNDLSILWGIGCQIQGKKYFVYKDKNNELVIY
jgi:uncharacterized phage-associated protein